MNAPAISLEGFSEAFTALRALRAVELIDAGVIPYAGGADYQRFRSNPPHFLLTAPDEIQKRLWALVEQRLGSAAGRVIGGTGIARARDQVIVP